MARSGWVAAAITALLVAGLGNEPMGDRARESGTGTRDLMISLTSFPQWSTKAFTQGSDLIGPLSLKIILFLFAVFLGAGLVGRVGSSTAVFLAGWGTVMLAAALAGAVFWLVADATVFDGQAADSRGGIVPLTVQGLNSGVQFGLYTGWLVGLGLLVSARSPRAEPEWVAPTPAQPPAPPATSTSYPTVYPPLPASGEWSGLTAPTPAVGRPAPKKAPAPVEAQPQAQDHEDAPRPLWPRTLPRNAPGGGAYGAQRQHRRPNWTRWSSSDSEE